MKSTQSVKTSTVQNATLVLPFKGIKHQCIALSLHPVMRLMIRKPPLLLMTTQSALSHFYQSRYRDCSTASLELLTQIILAAHVRAFISGETGLKLV